MEYEIEHKPSYALVTVDMEQGEQIISEAGAMVSHSNGIAVETSASGGVLGSLKRKAFGGESFFMNTFSANQAGHVTLAPPLPGDAIQYSLDGGPLYVQSGSFIAAEPNVDTDTKFGGAKSFFGGEGLFLLELTGVGSTFLSSYGAIHSVELAAGEQYTVDTGHIVAFEGSTEYNVKRVGGLKSTLFSGEGLVCDFTGPGTVWLQTRSPDAFLSWIIPNLPTSNDGGGRGGFSF